ncbi:hypothetical protein RHSIM_Rhsim11G0181600 [Rhododendron simsii]|uniref:Uncharacterized protein n=1 Tax=Rhododendron simsii TaxID=118357 RepID=A0A834G8V4_RHOSS|nr:hypothetical protein RHSIM_Rhsim11G0181600 [Rhododendron simsii]
MLLMHSLQKGWTQRLLFRNFLLFDNMGSMHISQVKGSSGCSCWGFVEFVSPWCGIKWHWGFSCEESGEMRDSNDIAFRELARRKNWMRCPGCKHFVMLVHGCPIVKGQIADLWKRLPSAFCC